MVRWRLLVRVVQLVHLLQLWNIFRDLHLQFFLLFAVLNVGLNRIYFVLYLVSFALFYLKKITAVVLVVYAMIKLLLIVGHAILVFVVLLICFYLFYHLHFKAPSPLKGTQL